MDSYVKAFSMIGIFVWNLVSSSTCGRWRWRWEVGGLFTSRYKQINPLGSKLWSASLSRFYLTRAQYCATLWSMDEKKKSVTGD